LGSEVHVVLLNVGIDPLGLGLLRQKLLGCSLIVVGLLQGSQDVFKGVLDSSLVFTDVDGSLVKLSLVEQFVDLDSDGDWETEWISVLSVEVQGHFMDGVTGHGLFSDLDWNAHLDLLVLVDWEVNWDDDLFDVSLGLRLELALKSGSFLPGSGLKVLDLDVGENGLSWLAPEDFLWEGIKMSLSLSPVIVLWSAVTCSSATSEASSVESMASSSTTRTSVHASNEVSEEGWVLVLLINLLLDISLGVWHVFVDDGKHGLWNLLWLVDL